MRQIIGKFFARIRQTLFASRIEREIYHRIFPHLNRRANNGYPFASRDEMVALNIRRNLRARVNLRFIEQTAAEMPKAYGDAFRYIAYRDLNERMEMYLKLAEQRVQRHACDSRLVASRA